jgi:pyruvate,water dikinase
MINSLNTMAAGSYVSLQEYHKKFDFYGRFPLAPPAIDVAPPMLFPWNR